jgi:hypothetical protein
MITLNELGQPKNSGFPQAGSPRMSIVMKRVVVERVAINAQILPYMGAGG